VPSFLADPACKSIEKELGNPVDTQTRHALKQDKFARTAASSMSWVSGHRSNILRWVITCAVVLVVVVGAFVFWTMKTNAADRALGAALDLYSTPLAQPGAPAEKNVYNTAAERSKEANREFVAIAKNYSWLPQAGRAHYFAGVTFQELGQTASAESELKTAVGSWDRNLSNLAKIALAGIYRQTGRDAQAIELYNQVAAKPSTTVPATVAQLDLADLYASTGKQDQARALWAKVKDSDKDGVAGNIATQKLTGK
jgi:predicted negative regulator of RcsB-dependent stress response